MTIQIVEDDGALSDGIVLALREPELCFVQSRDVKSAKEDFTERSPELVILDVNLPDGSGYDYLKWLRERSQLPVLVLTANDMEMDEVRSLALGADDYMTKPADEEELLLRIKALLRRARIASEHRLSVGKTELDCDSMTVRRGNNVTFLPPKEFMLLYKLLAYPNKIFTRIQLLEDIWGPASESLEATVSVHINRLRSHLKENPDFDIITIRGLGYKAQVKEAAP